MKRFLICLLAALTALALPFQACAEPRREVIYFYENYCEACTPEEDFAAYFLSLTGVALSDCDFHAYNVARSDGRAALEDAAARFGLTETAVPLAIVDGVAYSGASRMETALPTDALEWGTETDSVIVYLYVPYCESCARVASVLDSLPETVMLKRGSIEIESAVSVQRIDISAQPEIAAGLFDAYDVPDDRRITPIVFFADRFLAGADSIEKDLSAMVGLGWAAGGVRAPSGE